MTHSEKSGVHLQHQEFEIGRGIKLSAIDHLKAFLPAVVQLAIAEEAARHLERGIRAAAEGEMLEWHIFEDQILCGAIRLKDIDHSARSATVAYFIGERYQGRGIFTLGLLRSDFESAMK